MDHRCHSRSSWGVETGKFDQSDIEWRQLVEIVRTPALSGSLAPFPPVGGGDPGSVPRVPTPQRKPYGQTELRLGCCRVRCWGAAVPVPASACERPRHEPRPATPHRPDRSQGVKHGPQHDHLTSARVGSRASCSLRQAASRSPIRGATAPMPVAPPVTPVVAVPAPPAALGYQFDGRHDAQRARLG